MPDVKCPHTCKAIADNPRLGPAVTSKIDQAVAAGVSWSAIITAIVTTLTTVGPQISAIMAAIDALIAAVKPNPVPAGS